MKRIKAACLTQTIHFQLRDNLPHDAAVQAHHAQPVPGAAAEPADGLLLGGRGVVLGPGLDEQEGARGGVVAAAGGGGAGHRARVERAETRIAVSGAACRRAC